MLSPSARWPFKDAAIAVSNEQRRRVYRRLPAASDKSICKNHLTIRRDEIEAPGPARAARETPCRELLEEFCRDFTHEMNRLRMAAGASVTAAARELRRWRSLR